MKYFLSAKCIFYELRPWSVIDKKKGPALCSIFITIGPYFEYPCYMEIKAYYAKYVCIFYNFAFVWC